MRVTCEKCTFFKTRQGKGKVGECRLNPPVILLGSPIAEFPIVNLTDWCGKGELNLDKYHVSGKKIYTRINTRKISSQDELTEYQNGKSWGDMNGR